MTWNFKARDNEYIRCEHVLLINVRKKKDWIIPHRLSNHCYSVGVFSKGLTSTDLLKLTLRLLSLLVSNFPHVSEEIVHSIQFKLSENFHHGTTQTLVCFRYTLLHFCRLLDNAGPTVSEHFQAKCALQWLHSWYVNSVLPHKAE